jgi:hypothetical protein
MPILASETSVYPDDLLQADNWDSESFESCVDHPTWWILHTRPRQEKSIARDLLRRRIPFYLPLVRRRLLIRGRPVQSHVPLFAGYAFIYGTREHRLQALATDRVAQSFAVIDGARLRSELQRVEQLISAGVPLTIESRLQVNQRVRVRAGALAGMEGIICRRRNETRLIVWIQLLQQGVSLEIEDFLLEPIG